MPDESFAIKHRTDPILLLICGSRGDTQVWRHKGFVFIQLTGYRYNGLSTEEKVDLRRVLITYLQKICAAQEQTSMYSLHERNATQTLRHGHTIACWTDTVTNTETLDRHIVHDVHLLRCWLELRYIRQEQVSSALRVTLQIGLPYNLANVHRRFVGRCLFTWRQQQSSRHSRHVFENFAFYRRGSCFLWGCSRPRRAEAQSGYRMLSRSPETNSDQKDKMRENAVPKIVDTLYNLLITYRDHSEIVKNSLQNIADYIRMSAYSHLWLCPEWIEVGLIVNERFLSVFGNFLNNTEVRSHVLRCFYEVCHDAMKTDARR